jgi:hypothetical protein
MGKKKEKKAVAMTKNFIIKVKVLRVWYHKKKKKENTSPWKTMLLDLFLLAESTSPRQGHVQECQDICMSCIFLANY